VSQTSPSTNTEQTNVTAFSVLQEPTLPAITATRCPFAKDDTRANSDGARANSNITAPVPDRQTSCAKAEIAPESDTGKHAAVPPTVTTRGLELRDAAATPGSASETRLQESGPHPDDKTTLGPTGAVVDAKAPLSADAMLPATSMATLANPKPQVPAVEMKPLSNERPKGGNSVGASTAETRSHEAFLDMPDAKPLEARLSAQDTSVANDIQNAPTPVSADPRMSQQLPGKANQSLPHSTDTPLRTAETVPAFTGLVHAARVVERVGQSEMHIGLTTTSFGNVEVRTVIRDNQVGLSFASERGDLKGLVAPEMPSLESSFRQYDLRLNSLQFNNHQMGYGAGQGSGNGQDPRSFRFVQSGDSSQQSLDNLPDVNFKPMILLSNKGLNIRA
jgi:hypothetical protein